MEEKYNYLIVRKSDKVVIYIQPTKEDAQDIIYRYCRASLFTVNELEIVVINTKYLKNN